jgi:excisionase family DNA binding protein
MAAQTAGATTLIQPGTVKSPFYSIDEVCQIIGRSKATVYRMIADGIFESVGVPVRPKVTKRSVDKYLKSLLPTAKRAPRKPPGKKD